MNNLVDPRGSENGLGGQNMSYGQSKSCGRTIDLDAFSICEIIDNLQFVHVI